MSDDSKTVPVIRYRGADITSDFAHLISEAVLTVNINGKTMFTPARTPGDEAVQAAGLCVGAGIPIAHENIRVSPDCSVVDITIPEFDDQNPRPPCPVTDPFKFPVSKIIDAGRILSDAQHLRRKTHSTHAAVIFDAGFSVIAASEDVSRHSAIDKVIGMAFLGGTLSSAKAIMLTCRQNSDVMVKIVNAGIPVLLSVSRPTVSALLTAKEYGLTVALLGRNDEVVSFCGEHRLIP